jgi:hypothetical protein
LWPFRFSQELNALRANVFQKLLAKYRAGKIQYQELKKKLEKLSGKLEAPCFADFAVVLPALILPLSDSASLIASLESQLADSVSVATVESLKRKHAGERFRVCRPRPPGLRSWKLSWRKLGRRGRRCSWNLTIGWLKRRESSLRSLTAR